MKKLFLVVFIFIAVSFTSFAQEKEKSPWKHLSNDNHLDIYYDSLALSGINSPSYEVWLVEWHNPSIMIDGIAAKIERTKTLYTLDETKKMYSIKQVEYYTTGSKLAQMYFYDIVDSYKAIGRYSFPIYEGTTLDAVLSMRQSIRQKN